MKQCTEDFKNFYTHKHHNRRLEWLFHNGQCEVQPLFGEKPYQLVVNVFQATILDLFNQQDSFTVQELMNRTQIPKTNFNGAVLAMCNPKFRVLNK